jgi:hypothetical protein
MEENIPKATHSGNLILGNIEIPCFVLENGTRVISGRGMTKAIGMKGRGQGIARIADHKALKPFFSKELKVAIENPIQFVGPSSRRINPTYGYEATILHDLCDAILTARENGVLKTEHDQRYAYFAEVLIRSFAKIGIIALVDEATGYQYDRDRNALYKILDAYVAKELLPWAKRFPDEYYQELFRLRGWRYSPMSVARPQYVGKLTNDLIYDRLPPGIKEELQRKNPITEKRWRRHRHHQYLTVDLGVPHLEKLLVATIALMKASPNWSTFKRLFVRAFPKPGDQLSLDLDSDR